MYIYLINADSQKEKERVKELKTGDKTKKDTRGRVETGRETYTEELGRERGMGKSGGSGENSERNGLLLLLLSRFSRI